MIDPKIHLHLYDLPKDFEAGNSIAIDTEAMGLYNHRDRLCLVQLTNGDGHVHLVHFPEPDFSKSPNLKKMLINKDVEKIWHYARFDVAILQHSFNIQINNIFCTKIASRLTRTYTERHGLKELCKQLLGVELSKQEQTSDWGAPMLTFDQQMYAARDVLYLHDLKKVFVNLLKREKRHDMAKACFNFLPYKAFMDLWGNENFDIFSHS